MAPRWLPVERPAGNRQHSVTAETPWRKELSHRLILLNRHPPGHTDEPEVDVSFLLPRGSTFRTIGDRTTERSPVPIEVLRCGAIPGSPGSLGATEPARYKTDSGYARCLSRRDLDLAQAGRRLATPGLSLDAPFQSGLGPTAAGISPSANKAHHVTGPDVPHPRQSAGVTFLHLP